MRAQAVAWVQQHAAEFGGDPQRIVLMGHSAGAHMAAFLAFNHEFLASGGRAAARRSRGLIGLSGPYALDPNSRRAAHDLRSPYTEADWQPVRFVDAAVAAHAALPRRERHRRRGRRTPRCCATHCWRGTCASRRRFFPTAATPIRWRRSHWARATARRCWSASVEFIESVSASPSPSAPVDFFASSPSRFAHRLLPRRRRAASHLRTDPSP